MYYKKRSEEAGWYKCKYNDCWTDFFSIKSQAASALLVIQAPTSLAERTTVSGDNQAKSSGSDLAAALQGISNALAKDGNNVYSVAKEFAAIDQQVKAQFDTINSLFPDSLSLEVKKLKNAALELLAKTDNPSDPHEVKKWVDC